MATTIQPRLDDNRGLVEAVNQRGAATTIVTLWLLAGCGGENPTAPRAQLGAGQFETMTSDLTNAATQGQLNAQQATAGAERQARITRSYASKVGKGECKTSLTRLSAAYEAFARAATTATDDDAYAATAGDISAALQTAEDACT